MFVIADRKTTVRLFLKKLKLKKTAETFPKIQRYYPGVESYSCDNQIFNKHYLPCKRQEKLGHVKYYFCHHKMFIEPCRNLTEKNVSI